jgi:hypothetical protein
MFAGALEIFTSKVQWEIPLWQQRNPEMDIFVKIMIVDW